MGRLFIIVRAKLALLAAVISGAVIGGATTGMVMAAIPDNNGQINACYKNSTQILRVTDPVGNCATNETALSWNQVGSGGVLATGHIKEDGTLDAVHTTNVTTFTPVYDSGGQNFGYCIKVPFVPLFAIISVGTQIASSSVVVISPSAGSDQQIEFSQHCTSDYNVWFNPITPVSGFDTQFIIYKDPAY